MPVPCSLREALLIKKPHLQVTAAVIGHDGRVMIARRPPGSMHAGVWEFPGGKREAGESLRECLFREIREELDLEVEVGRPIISVDHDYGEFSLTLHAFLCRLSSGQNIPEESDDLAWVRPEDLSGRDLLPPDRRIAAALLNSRGGPDVSEGT